MNQSRLRTSAPSPVLAALLALAALTPCVAQDAALDPAHAVRLVVSSEPAEASVFVRYPGEGDQAEETFLGTTPKQGPLELDLDRPGPAEVVVFKDGFVCKVETLELRSGGASRLEVRLTKDVAIPRRLTLKDSQAFVKDARQFDELYMSVLFNTVRFYVEEKHPRDLIESSVTTLVGILNAVRAREKVLRRELAPEARQRYYGDELDLRGYPALELTFGPPVDGARIFTLAAGGVAITGSTDEDDINTYLEMLHKVYAFLKHKWDARKLLSDAVLTRCAIEGLLEALGDEHTHFMPPSEVTRMETDSKGSFGGIGVVVSMRGGRLTVVSPIAGTPGAEAGIRAGDVIVKVDGTSTERISMQDAVRLMRGPVGTQVSIRVRRGDAELTLPIVRAEVKIKTTAHGVLRGDVGYLRITSFMDEHLATQVETAIKALKIQGAKSLIIDLRNNPGGLLTQAHAIADLFVPDGVIVATQTRLPEESRRLLADPEREKLKLPVAILINKGSASASEILAGTLQERGLAKVVGETSFGKGSVQRVLDLSPFGCALALTVATYHLPSGETPHKRGVTPDVVVELEPEELKLLAEQSNYADDEVVAEDAQVRAALKALGK